jgi:WD40 repeat protein
VRTPQRWFIGAATTRYRPDSGCEDLPELTGQVQQMAALFTRLGYRSVPGFDGNLGIVGFRQRLRAFLSSGERHDDDIVTIYYTGHGHPDGADLFLSLADTTDDVAGSSLPAGYFTTDLLRETTSANLLVLLDVCYSGPDGQDLADDVVGHLDRFQGLDGGRDVAVVVATRPTDAALIGEFARALAAAVDHPSTGGAEPPFLPVDEVVAVVKATTAATQHARLFLAGDATAPFLPNPRRDHQPRDRDLRAQARRRSSPGTDSIALSDDLDARLGPDADRARGLLLPLAYARGHGLPWEDVWARLATALTGVPCRSQDLEWLIEHAGSYVLEATADGGRRSVYRIFPEPLAELLRAARSDPVSDETAIVDALTAQVDRLPDGQPDWDRARPYTRAYLASHAAITPRFDALVDDPRFLLAADPSPLLEALPHATGTARAAAGAYHRADDRLRGCPVRHRPAYLQLAARCSHAPHLADRITASGLPLAWTTEWASCQLQPLDITLTGHTDAVRSVAFGQIDGRPIVVSGGDHTVRVWDAATGTPIGGPFTGHTDTVNAVAFGQIDDHPVVASASWDGTVRIWDAATGTPVGKPFTGHTNAVYAVAFGQLNGRPVITSGGFDGTVRVWDAATGTALGDPLLGHAESVYAVAFGQLNGGPVVASGGEDGTVRIWDAATGAALADPFIGHVGMVHSVTFGQVNDRPVVVSGGEDGTVHVWDALTGTALNELLTDHTEEVHTVAIGQLDGRPVIASGSGYRTVRVWDATTGTPIGGPFDGPTGWVTAVAFGQIDGRPVLACGNGYDGTIRVWDATTGTPADDLFSSHTDEVTTVAVGQIDGRPVLASASDDATIQVWDAATGTPLGTPLTGHTDAVNTVAFGQVHGRPVLASGSHDGTVRLWDMATRAPFSETRPGPVRPGIPVSRIDVAAAVTSVQFWGDGRLVVGTELGVVSLRLAP